MYFAAIDGTSNVENASASGPWHGHLEVISDIVATPEVMNILSDPSSRLWSACEWNGVRYSARGDAPLNEIGDSQVCFHRTGCKFVTPGFIECIVEGSSPVFIVRPLLLTPSEKDPFTRYPDAPMAVFQSNPQQPLEAVDFGSIAGHFAACLLADSHFVVVPLFTI